MSQNLLLYSLLAIASVFLTLSAFLVLVFLGLLNQGAQVIRLFMEKPGRGYRRSLTTGAGSFGCP